MGETPPPKIVLVAGMPRSGSTWMFNAARMLLEHGEDRVHAAWVADRDPGDPARLHLVKAHRPAEVDFTADLVLTTWRPFEDCLVSLVRIGWLAPSAEAILARGREIRSLYRHWAARSDLEIAFAEITDDPAGALRRLSAVLGQIVPEDRFARIEAELRALSAPASGGYDKRTLLHPRHRAAPGEHTISAEEVRDILAADPDFADLR